MPWEINQRYKSELLPLMIYQFKSTIPVNSNHSREITYFEKIEQRVKTELLHSIIHARIWRTSLTFQMSRIAHDKFCTT